MLACLVLVAPFYKNAPVIRVRANLGLWAMLWEITGQPYDRSDSENIQGSLQSSQSLGCLARPVLGSVGDIILDE